MKGFLATLARIPSLAVVIGGIHGTGMVAARAAAGAGGEEKIYLISMQREGGVQYMPARSGKWLMAAQSQVQSNQFTLDPGDRIRTLDNCRASLRLPDNTVVPIGPLTEVEILPPEDPNSAAGLHLVNGQEQTTVSVFDGTVRLTNSAGSLVLTNGQQGFAQAGGAPVRAPGCCWTRTAPSRAPTWPHLPGRRHDGRERVRGRARGHG